MPGPLHGTKVIDAGSYAAGPCAAALLGFLGADVIRIENPSGDGLMDIKPLMGGMGASYINANLQKRNVRLNLRHPDSQHIARALLRWADVLVENRLAGVLERLGLGYEDAARANPRLVYVSNPGYGSSGPCSQWPALDPYVQAMSGFAGIQGSEGGPPELFRTYGHLDQFAALSLAQAALVGLLARQRSGRGLHLESSQFATTLFVQLTRIAEFFATGQNPARQGSASSLYAPSQSFRCLDGRYINITAPNDAVWERLCDALGLEALREDERFGSNESRLQHRQALARQIQARTEEAPSWWWLRLLPARGVPCGPLYDFEEQLRDPHIQHEAMVVKVPTQWGEVYHGGHPWRFSATPCGPIEGTHAPGQDETEVFAELGESAATT